jgi:dCTP deaminase
MTLTNTSPQFLGIDPVPSDLAIQPASIDITLGEGFKRWLPSLTDGTFNAYAPMFDKAIMRADQFMEMVKPHELIEGGTYLLPPGQMVLGTTVEVVTLGAGLAAHVEGKSSWGRLGVIVETAGYIDPGFSGEITLEIVNHSLMWMVLRPGMCIGQLIVHQLTSPAERPYGSPGLGSRYQGQRGPQESRREAARHEG